MARLPLRVGHSVNRFPRVRVAEFDPSFLGGGAIPLRQAVSAETGEIHHVDILHVRALTKVLNQTAKRGRLDLELSSFVHVSAQRTSPQRSWLGPFRGRETCNAICARPRGGFGRWERPRRHSAKSPGHDYWRFTRLWYSPLGPEWSSAQSSLAPRTSNLNCTIVCAERRRGSRS
jgi:hypothetical protein